MSTIDIQEESMKQKNKEKEEELKEKENDLVYNYTTYPDDNSRIEKRTMK